MEFLFTLTKGWLDLGKVGLILEERGLIVSGLL